MSSEARQLDAERVLGLFHELSERLAADGVQAQLFVVGGAAMSLAYDEGRLTRDVDALFVPAPEVRVAAGEIGAAHGLEPDWLNDAAKGFLPGADEHPQTVFESESLLVQVASPEYLLAMKLHASRDERDLDDAATLFNRLGYTTAQEAADLLSHTYPQEQLLPRHYYIAEDVAHRATAGGTMHGAAVGAETPDTGAERLRRSIEDEVRQDPGGGRARHSPPEAATSRPIEPPMSSRPPEPPSIGF
ncbi:MAG: hypothetical protein WAR57_05220 [Candidatus Phosphoribacter sp.]|nr:nucleotidyl transferase [Actinomycetales bacterium]